MNKAICIGIDNRSRGGIDCFLYFLGKLKGDAAAERLEEIDDADEACGDLVGAKEMNDGFASRRATTAV